MLLGVAAVAALASVPYLPTNDGPQHVFAGVAANHLDEAARGYGRYLERRQPITSLGFHALFSTLELVLPWRVALTTTLATIVLLWGGGYTTLARLVRPERAVLGLLGFAMALGWPLYMGLFSFALGTALGFWILAFALWRRPAQPLDRIALALALVIQAMAHLFTAQATALALVALTLSCSPKERRLKELGLLALVGLPTMGIAALTLTSGASALFTTDMATADLATTASDFGPLDRVALLAETFVSGPWWRGGAPVLLAIGGLAWTARSWRDAPALERGLAVAGAILLVLAVAVPFDITGWEYLGPRFIPLGVSLGILLVPIERLGRPRWAMASVALWSLAAVAWAGWFHRALYRRCEIALSGLDAPVTRSGPRLGVTFDLTAGLPSHDRWRQADVPFIKPLLNLGQLYAASQGGVPSWLFTSRPELHPIAFSDEGRRSYPPVHDAVAITDPEVLGDPARRGELVAFLAALGSHFEDVVLSATPADVDGLAARGYALDHRREGFALARFVGCPMTVSLATEAPLDAPLVVRCGYSLAQPPSGLWIVPEGTPPVDGAIVVDAARCLCGDGWTQIFVDRDGSSAPSSGDGFCRDTDRNAMIQGRAEGPRSFRCVLADQN